MGDDGTVVEWAPLLPHCKMICGLNPPSVLPCVGFSLGSPSPKTCNMLVNWWCTRPPASAALRGQWMDGLLWVRMAEVRCGTRRVLVLLSALATNNKNHSMFYLLTDKTDSMYLSSPMTMNWIIIRCCSVFPGLPLPSWQLCDASGPQRSPAVTHSDN